MEKYLPVFLIIVILNIFGCSKGEDQNVFLAERELVTFVECIERTLYVKAYALVSTEMRESMTFDEFSNFLKETKINKKTIKGKTLIKVYVKNIKSFGSKNEKYIMFLNKNYLYELDGNGDDDDYTILNISVGVTQSGEVEIVYVGVAEADESYKKYKVEAFEFTQSQIDNMVKYVRKYILK